MNQWVNSSRILIVLVAAAFVLVMAVTKTMVPLEAADTASPHVIVGGQVVEVELADTASERAEGLSRVKKLAEGRGMLFIFEQPKRPAFWMRDMRFAVDIIWIDANQRVVDITPRLSPATYPEVFRPTQAVQYALEVNSGFAADHGVTMGSTVDVNLE